MTTAGLATTTTLRVLVVEDSKTNVAVITGLLAEYGDVAARPLAVTVSGDLATAQKHVVDGDVDVVLLDLTLPDSSGLNTYDAVAATADLPIVVLTGSEDHALAVEAVRRGAQDFVVKTQLSAVALGRIVDYAYERHHLTENLRGAVAEARLANRRVRDLVSMASHELLSPMSAVRGFAQLLTERWDDLDDAQRREYASTVHRRSEHLTRLARQFLDVASAGDDRIEAHPARFDAVASVRAVVESLGQADRVRVLAPVRLDLTADRDHVESILTNLLTNAAKYGQPPVDIEVSREEERLLLVVQDAGDGVPAELLPSLFEAYTRADTAMPNGHGLGMHIVARLVEANGGTVAYAGDRQGARFEVRIPDATA
jgi:signal transduction histidine kinase